MIMEKEIGKKLSEYVKMEIAFHMQSDYQMQEIY